MKCPTCKTKSRNCEYCPNCKVPLKSKASVNAPSQAATDTKPTVSARRRIIAIVLIIVFIAPAMGTVYLIIRPFLPDNNSSPAILNRINVVTCTVDHITREYTVTFTNISEQDLAIAHLILGAYKNRKRQATYTIPVNRIITPGQTRTETDFVLGTATTFVHQDHEYRVINVLLFISA